MRLVLDAEINDLVCKNKVKEFTSKILKDKEAPKKNNFDEKCNFQVLIVK